MKLTPENYQKGLLIDPECMAGVSEKPGGAGFSAFVIRQDTAEYLAYSDFPTLDEALSAINRIPREWAFESSSGCGNCEDGSCGQGKCSVKEGEPCPIGKTTACSSSLPSSTEA